MSSRKIRIKHGTDIKSIIVKDEKLKKSVLKDYFHKNGTLMYKLKEEEFMLYTDTDNIYLESDVEIYFFSESKDKSLPHLSNERRKRYQEILDDLYDKRLG